MIDRLFLFSSSDQLVFYHAENRLLYNYLIWYEKKILQLDNTEQRNSIVSPTDHKHPLSIDKKRDIAEVSFKVLLTYSQNYDHRTSHYVDECIVSHSRLIFSHIDEDFRIH